MSLMFGDAEGTNPYLTIFTRKRNLLPLVSWTFTLLSLDV